MSDDGVSRRSVLAAAGVVGMLSAAGGVAAAAVRERPVPRARAGAKGPRSRRPNILMIVTDQERSFADIPAKIPMPAHEWLRERGVTIV